MKAISCVNVGRFISANRVPLAALVGLAVIGGCSAGGATLVNPADIQGVSVNPTSVTVTVGGAAQPVAANVDAIDNAPATVSWTSSDPSVASVAPSGNSAMVTGMKSGTATITATSTANSAQHADASVRVMPGALARIQVTASATQVAAYATLPVHAVALDAGGDTLASPTFTWSSSNPSVATVDGNGAVTGVAPGTVNITGTVGSVTSNALALTVVNPPVASITVSAPSSSMVMLSTMQATAVAKDASGHVLQGVTFSWASSNTGVATVSSSGLITALLTGTTSITASSGGVTSSSLTVTVTAPVVSTITVTGPSSVTQHSTASLHATAYDARGNALSGVAFTWTSSDPSVATVSTAGLVAGVALGLVTITAASGSVTSNAFKVAVVNAPVASITVTAGTSTVTAYQTLQAQAVARDASGNVVTGQSFSWTSSNPSVATVDGNGLVTGVAPGTASITATTGSVTSNALTLTVINPPVATVTVSAPSSSMGLLSTMQATAVARDASGHVLQGVTFSWASGNTLVATVSNSGLISSLLVGTTTVTASSEGATSNAFTVTVGL